jgi:serine/threonine protein kinase
VQECNPRGLSVIEVKKIMWQLVLALNFLHGQKVWGSGRLQRLTSRERNTSGRWIRRQNRPALAIARHVNAGNRLLGSQIIHRDIKPENILMDDQVRS